MLRRKRKVESEGVLLGRIRYGSDTALADYALQLRRQYAEEIERIDKPRVKSAEVRKRKKEEKEKRIQDRYLSYVDSGLAAPSQKAIALDLGVSNTDVSRALSSLQVTRKVTKKI